MNDERHPTERFDAPAYWRARLRANPSLEGTGTARLPLAWQRWMYRSKQRAYSRLLGRNGFHFEGSQIINWGCGTGFFEDAWERAGARTNGIDIVPDVIERLSAEHPNRIYVCANLSEESDLSRLPQAHLVTAIDVAYHVVDDELLKAAVARLAKLMLPGGRFLFTDTLRNAATPPHVRFRTLEFWNRVLAENGLRIIDREPVFVAANRGVPGLSRLPRLVDALQYYSDAVLLRTLPERATNWALIAQHNDV